MKYEVYNVTKGFTSLYLHWRSGVSEHLHVFLLDHSLQWK